MEKPQDNNQEQIADEEVNDVDLETSFNKSLDDLRKSVDEDVSEASEKKSLKKAKKTKGDEEYDDESEEEDDEKAEDEEDEDEKDVKKSVEDILAEEPEAEAAMDVEPFLRQLAKAMDRRIDVMAKSVNKDVNGVVDLVKAQSKMLIASAELQKSIKETTDKVAQGPVPSTSMRTLQKARFEGNNNKSFTGVDVLSKSRDWVREQKVDLMEAGKIEMRANNGSLGKIGDVLDNKIKQLMSEEA